MEAELQLKCAVLEPDIHIQHVPPPAAGGDDAPLHQRIVEVLGGLPHRVVGLRAHEQIERSMDPGAKCAHGCE